MNEQRYAVLIASSQYPNEPKLQDLRCPENDVDALDKLLSSKDHGDFTETFVLKNKPHHEVLLKINQVLRGAGKDDLVLLYYSGHGKLNLAERLHLATVNTVLDALEATSIPVESIRNFVDISPSNKVILILDCCYSGAAGAAFARGSMDEQLQQISGGRGTYILTASTGIQVAKEKELDQYGVLTKHIIEGIRGGEADQNGDGQVDMDELYHYVHDRVLEEGCQEPMKWDLNVRGELIIAHSGKTPQADWRREVKKLLLELAGKGLLPDSILSKAMEVIALNKDQLQGTLQSYDLLLDQLMQEKLEFGDFVDKWYKVEPEPLPKVSEPPLEVKNIFCPKCGKANNEQAKFCYACGTNLQITPELEYAPFWKRGVAFLIDVSIFIPLWFVIGTTLDVTTGMYHSEITFWSTILSILLLWLYYAIMESSSKQATIGKIIMGLVVTDLDGNRISFGRATGRFFRKIYSILILFFGFFMAGFTKKKQALHDKIAGCLVVKKR